MPAATPLFDKSGGYRRLHAFTYVTLIHLETIRFCKRFISYRDDPLGKTVGQMVGAARSGRQNVIEGSERAATSKETEIKLTDVARASLSELLGDYEVFLAERGEIPWSRADARHQALRAIRLPEFVMTDDPVHDYWRYFHEQRPRFADVLDTDDPVTVANAMIVIIGQAMAMLGGQLRALGDAFVSDGGFRERMHRCRTEQRDAESSAAGAPNCPQCAAPMRLKKSRTGNPFWSCSRYPACKGAQNATATP